MKPDPCNVEKVFKWKAPRNRKELECFLGLACYYREYIKDFSGLVAPMNDLKKKGVEFTWGGGSEKKLSRR